MVRDSLQRRIVNAVCSISREIKEGYVGYVEERRMGMELERDKVARDYFNLCRDAALNNSSKYAEWARIPQSPEKLKERYREMGVSPDKK